MIKKLQALKAKKGFTLVELVVVIAIIGVLAAILIPVMIGVVQDANITSADTLAKQIYSNVETYRTNADSAKNGLRNVGSTVSVMSATIGSGKWNITAPTGTPAPQFGGADKYFWTAAEATAKNVTPTKDNNLQMFLEDVLREFSDGVAYVYFQNGACIGAAVQQGTGDVIGGTNGISDDLEVAFQAGKAKEISTWDGKAGILSGGVIIGTNPKIAFGTGNDS